MFKPLLAVLSLLVCLVYILWQDSFDNLPGQDYIFLTRTGEYKLHLKIADTQTAQEKGLMHIDTIPENSGMLFVNAQPQISVFWMKDTYIPLDIIFLDEYKTVVNIHENAKPLDEFNKISSVVPVKYTVELNAGMVSEMELAVGDTLLEPDM